MLHNIKEYQELFSAGAHGSLASRVKSDGDLGLAAIIMLVLNKKKYDNIDDFIKRNENYQDFLKNNNTDIAVQHFGNFNKHKITEEDFVRVLNNIKFLIQEKKDFDKENIKTTDIGNNQYVTFEGKDKTTFIDNYNSNKTIEEQMKDLQLTEQKFQTIDKKENTENMFKELEKRKETLNLNYLHEINFDLLSNEEKELYQIADNYQQNDKGVIRVDLKKGVIVDELDNIMKIEKNNGEFAIIKDGEVKEMEQVKEKTFQKTLTPSRNTIYSN